SRPIPGHWRARTRCEPRPARAPAAYRSASVCARASFFSLSSDNSNCLYILEDRLDKSLPLLDEIVVADALRLTRDEARSLCSAENFWTGELSSSALSTATAVVALEMVRRNALIP